MKKTLVNPGPDGKIIVKCSIFDIPLKFYDLFFYFVNPSTGKHIKGEQVISERLTDAKTYAQIFHTTDFRMAVSNKFGHTLKLAKQFLAGSGPEDFKFEAKEEEAGKYAIFYEENAMSKEDLDVDFKNQEMLCKRQERLLEKAQIKQEEYKPFELIKKLGLWIILMCHGGCFSIGIFNKRELIEHKSDKKYLVRRAGRRQINKDKTKTLMGSTGSQIRNEMEKEHQLHIAEIMEECKKYLSEAEVIFLHTPGINKQFFLKEGKPLQPYIKKIKTITIKTQKANFTNVMDVFKKLTSVELAFSPIS